MEVESQWRREWAGAAEYGKVTEGGVTRKVARALEVLHASRPGTQVRVMRAAWHSSAGPGAPASSYMVHSSQQFISSGSRLLTSPSLIKMSQPMEISSTPLDYSPDDGTDTENYKVTEPDDFEISQPSKWKSSNSRSSLRMPSEESSSTDNGSIIDLDFKYSSLKNNTWRRHSYESENSDVPKYKSRASPLLENPTTLSTLKYKSLLNNTNSSWDNRRKSYSFEDSSIVNDGNVERNDISAMESSTDSGICKSSELVNEKIDEEPEFNCINTEQFTNQLHEDSFKNWLARNRPNKIHKINVKVEKAKPVDNQFSLQSTGKVSISLASDPVTLSRRKKDEDDLRKAKRVEFCKTELHFAAESGRVNIISTDEKPPPSNDFRKRRSAFVPMKDNFDKPVTLFGDKFDDLLVINGNTNLNEVSECEQSDDYEENTAATKSILKNKIPKPKPYLLGENMEFGDKYYLQDNLRVSKSVSKPTAVSLIKKQLEEPECIKKKSYECREAIHTTNWENNKSKDKDHTVVERSLNTKKTIDDQREVIHSIKVLQSSPILQKLRNRQLKESELSNDDQSEFKRSIKLLQSSPILQAKSRTRQLKESELTYFGIKNKDNEKNYKKDNKISRDLKDNNMFNAVRLVQEATYNTSRVNKSDDELDYQNLPLRTDYIPVPVPRSRLKADVRIEEITKGHSEVVQEIEQIMNSRRRRLKKQEDDNNKSRSISEPPTNRKTSLSSVANIITRDNKSKANHKLEENMHSPVISLGESDKTTKLKMVQDKSQHIKSKNNKGAPIYQNIEIERKRAQKNKSTVENNDTSQTHSRPRSQNKKSDRSASTPENKKYIVQDYNNDQQLNKSNKESHKSKDMKHQSKSTHKHNINGKLNSTEKGSRNKYNKESISKESDKQTSTNNINKSAYNTHNISKKGDNCSSEIKKGSHSNNRKANNEVNHDKRHKRKEYVLNYDDKNGTFSSMNKVKHRSKSSDRGINDYSTKKKSSDNKNEGKSKEKYPLLQYPPQYNIHNGLHSQDKKWKPKVYVERTCQLL